DVVQPELELHDDSEVAASATEPPEQLRTLVGGYAHDLAVSRDDCVGRDVVAGQAVPACHPAHPAAEGETPDAGVRDVARGRGQAERLSGAVHGSQQRATLHPGTPGHGIHGDAVQAGEVDHEPAVGDGEPGDVVPTAAHADLQVALASHAHRVDDIGHRGAPDDHRGTTVDHRVPYRAGGVIGGIAGGEDLAVVPRTAGRRGGEVLR